MSDGQIAALFAAVTAAGREPPRRGVSARECAAMIEEGLAAVADLEARRRERWERHAAARQQGLEAYERANRQRAAGPGAGERLNVAASAWLYEPAPLAIW